MTSDAGFDQWWRRRYRKAAEKDPRDETIRRLRAMILDDYSDEQLEEGIAQLREVRKHLGAHASDESIVGVIYDGMMSVHRAALRDELDAKLAKARAALKDAP